MGPPIGHNQFGEPFRDQFVLFLKEVLQAFATTTPGYAHDKRSRWAYAFNPMSDGDAEKPVYATMAALRAPNFAALRVGVTEGGQVVVEVEHRKLVIPYITNDVENPKEFPKIQDGLKADRRASSKERPVSRTTLCSIALPLILNTGNSLSSGWLMPGSGLNCKRPGEALSAPLKQRFLSILGLKGLIAPDPC